METHYIVGLGNPGERYERTRHNVGFTVLDLALQAWNLPSLIEEKAVSGRTTEGVVGEQFVRVLYPNTFMNNSGAAVKKFVPTEAIDRLIVVHDDIDLPFGEVKIAFDRGAGGNNGIQSIIQALNSKSFTRVRVGIAPTSLWGGETKRPAGGGPLERFVLKPFGLLEQRQLPTVLATTKDALETILSEGVATAMNRYN